MISSKHSRGLEIEKNESALILRFPPARMCVRSLLLKGCRSCTAPLDVEIWAMGRPSHLGIIVLIPCGIICAISKTRVASKTSAWWLVSNLIRMPWLAKKCEINNQKSRASPAQTWIALVTLLATYKLYLEIFWTMAVARLQGLPSHLEGPKSSASCWCYVGGKCKATSILLLGKPQLESICHMALGCKQSTQWQSQEPLQPTHWNHHYMIARTCCIYLSGFLPSISCSLDLTCHA